jgi:hypothetical protein
VGSWSLRLVSIALTVILGGGSTVGSICKALCVGDAVSTTAVASSSHMSGHDHHHTLPSPDASDQLSAATTASMSRVGDCCKLLSRPRLSLAAYRVDTGLVPALGFTALAEAVPQDFANRSYWTPRGSPPVDTSERSRTILRI